MGHLFMKRERLNNILIHLVVISIVFVLPEVVSTQPQGCVATAGGIVLCVPYLKVAVLIGVFYLEYMLIKPERPRLQLFAGSFAIIFLGYLAFHLIFSHIWHCNVPPRIEYGIHLRNLAILLLTVGLSVAMRLSERMRKVEATRQADELRQLKMQLNPHFLFNSLNTVYALTEFDPERARKTIRELSALLRYAIYEADSPTVKLSREIDFVNDYINLMKARLDTTVEITFDTDISPGMYNADIAPMLFITLIENAFKHGSKGVGSYVTMHISASDDGDISCLVANTFIPGNKTDNGGTGLANLQRRLSLIYGDRQNLSITHDDPVFTALMQIRGAGHRR